MIFAVVSIVFWSWVGFGVTKELRVEYRKRQAGYDARVDSAKMGLIRD